MSSEQFKQIYYPYYEKLYQIAFRMLMDSHSAEDIVQETYLKLWDKRYELDNVEQPQAYAVTTVKNLCMNYMRQNKNMTDVSYEHNIPEPKSLTVELEVSDEARFMKKLIEKLPKQQRQVIMLRHYDGYTYEEIKEITGMDVANIRVMISRARKVLRSQFDKIENYGNK